MASDTHQAIEAVWRIEAPKVIAAVARRVGDLSLAEDLAQDALVAALEQWPRTGIPDRPAAWLTAAAGHRAVDHLRRRSLLEHKHALLAHEVETPPSPPPELAFDNDIEDDLLRLIFTACHPVLATEARVALTLRLLGGLTTAEIARAFLVPEATLAQRIVRAKRTLSEAKVPFELPHGEDREARLASVLEVIYLIFNEGYSATTGDDWIRPSLCAEAVRLGRVLAGLMPREAEVHGLVALMELQASRLAARVGADGEPIRLLDQARSRWDRLAIGRGLASLARSERLSATAGPYTLQAAIAACHARALAAEETDWALIAALYATLVERTGSAVVRLNHAVAVAMADGPAAGLALVDALGDEPALSAYPYLPATRGDFLEKLGRRAEARLEFERAAALTQNSRERALLLERARASEDG